MATCASKVRATIRESSRRRPLGRASEARLACGSSVLRRLLDPAKFNADRSEGLGCCHQQTPDDGDIRLQAYSCGVPLGALQVPEVQEQIRRDDGEYHE